MSGSNNLDLSQYEDDLSHRMERENLEKAAQEWKKKYEDQGEIIRWMLKAKDTADKKNCYVRER